MKQLPGLLIMLALLGGVIFWGYESTNFAVRSEGIDRATATIVFAIYFVGFAVYSKMKD